MMRKAVRPGSDPTTKRDAFASAHSHAVPDKRRPVRAEGMFGGSRPDHSGNDVSLNDAWLVEHARHGDHQAFALLVRRYERKLLRVLTRLIRDPEHARDLAQETFWRVYVRLDGFDASRRFGPWLFRVAINLGLDWLRHSKYEPPLTASIHRADRTGQSIFDVPDADPRTQAELAQEVQFILGLVPVSYRTILVLRDLEGFSTSEVAAIVGRRESTVRWKLSVARDKFREIWERRQKGVRGEVKDGKSRVGHVDE
jgi:RNA polymerase sigma-70 factor, ECF subfamily